MILPDALGRIEKPWGTLGGRRVSPTAQITEWRVVFEILVDCSDTLTDMGTQAYNDVSYNC